MQGDKGMLLERLRQLSEVDAALARILAERKQFERSLSELEQGVREAQGDLEAKRKAHLEGKRKAERDEKFLQSEREKLIARRKMIGTLGDYKVQQAAMREIEAVSKQLDRQEEAVLQQIEEADSLAAALKEREDAAAKIRDEYESKHSSSAEYRSTIADREKEKKTLRDATAQGIDAEFLRRYAIILEKYPMDPISAVVDKRCAVCCMSISPQVILKIARGQSLETCPGCHRILYLSAVTVMKEEQSG